MTTRVLVDTSAWIDFFRRTEGEVGDTVANLVEEDQAVMTGPVLAELLRGVRSAKEGEELRVLLEALPYDISEYIMVEFINNMMDSGNHQ